MRSIDAYYYCSHHMLFSTTFLCGLPCSMPHPSGLPSLSEGQVPGSRGTWALRGFPGADGSLWGPGWCHGAQDS